MIALAPYLISAAVSILALTGGYFWAEGRGYERCREEVTLANAQAEREQRAILQTEWARGQKLSAELALKERQLNNLRAEYLTYANAVTGHCPADLGVLVDAASAGKPVPSAPGPSADPASTVAASAIAANIATNYPRCHACLAQLNALLDWIERKEGVK